MTVDIDKATSRPIGVAEQLARKPINPESVYSKLVVLTGEKEILLTENGRWCFLDSLSLLSRIVGNLIVVLPEGLGSLEEEAKQFCSRAWCRGSIRVEENGDTGILKDADAILSVGSIIMPTLPWTVINSNGWVARVSSVGDSLPNDVNQPNAMGALMAASLGSTEIFKRIFDIPVEVAPLLGKTEFSLFDQAASPTGVGPELKDAIEIPDTLLVGGGAIGNGIALLLSRLSLNGKVHVIDNQDYADENLGTCILLSTEWVGNPKAKRLATWILEHSNLMVTGEKTPIEAAKASPLLSGLNIDLILNGLDNVEARSEAQSLWPSIIVDGGINAIGASVIQYRSDQSRSACLKCWFEPPKLDERQLQSKLSGLNIKSLANINRLLDQEDLDLADKDKREWLVKCQKEGKTLCSIISEAVLSSELGIEVEDNFRPSVPFVATAAAAMVVATAIKSLAFPNIPATPMFQIANLFLGPDVSSIKLNRAPSTTCQCVVHRKMIERIVKQRKSRTKCASETD